MRKRNKKREKTLNEYRKKVWLCNDCRMPYKRYFGDGGRKYCQPCSTYLCVCSYCQKDFSISRKDYDDNRGKYCGLSCYREHLRLNPPTGKDHWHWVGGVKNIKGYGAVYKTAYRARKYKAEGSYSRHEWEKLKMKFNFMCLCCKKKEPEIKLTADHVVPLIEGGNNYIENIQPLCHRCNSTKWTDTVDYRLIFQNETTKKK